MSFAGPDVRLLKDGISPRIARRNVARSQATVMWGMWKRSDDYRPEWVGAGVGKSALSIGKQALPVG